MTNLNRRQALGALGSVSLASLLSTLLTTQLYTNLVPFVVSCPTIDV